MTHAAHDKRLLLLRHAKAEQTFGVLDHDRRLTDRGRRDAAEVGRWLARKGIVCDLVICSTAARTRETWDAAAQAGARTEFIEYRRQVYLGGSAGVLQSIREDSGDSRTILVVGHAPTMPALASALSDGEGSAKAHAALGEGYPTSGLAVLSYAGDWTMLGPASCSLDAFFVGRG
ncbi:MAG TPA: histidine phosphatase family protein [Dermatophilaceae bacterium]|nr:histidine phosphatase family protein [Dermatophilaceae bacterium]